MNFSIYGVGLRANRFASADFDHDKFRQKEMVFEPQNLPSSEEQSTKAKNDDSEKQQQCGQAV